MKRRLPLAIIPLLALLALVLRNDGSVADTAAVSSESNPAGTSAMRVYVDPTTGEFLQAPPPGAHVQMSEEQMAPFSTSASGLIEEDAPGGGKMVNLKGRFQQGFTARIDQSGAVVYECGHSDHPKTEDSKSEKEDEKP